MSNVVGHPPAGDDNPYHDIRESQMDPGPQLGQMNRGFPGEDPEDPRYLTLVGETYHDIRESQMDPGLPDPLPEQMNRGLTGLNPVGVPG